MQTVELITQLRVQAKEIADAGEPEWGNTMAMAAETLARYFDAIDAIYNHNEAARAAVIMHFGTLHRVADIRMQESPILIMQNKHKMRRENT